MKYHVHVHSLLTYGGIDEHGDWQYPKHKKRICRNSKLRHTFTEIFLLGLKKLFAEGRLTYDQTYREVVADLEDKQWSVFITHPTMSTSTIELYLARYINRIAVTNSRLEYVKHLEQVHLIHNDYKNQKEGEAAPKKVRVFEPLSFIHQLLHHLPPPYFQRTRRYGLHASSKGAAARKLISKKARANGRAIRTVMEIITHLMKLQPLECEKCGSQNFVTHNVSQDRDWIFQYITLPKIRSPV